jgi:hypothetical protein
VTNERSRSVVKPALSITEPWRGRAEEFVLIDEDLDVGRAALDLPGLISIRPRSKRHSWIIA